MIAPMKLFESLRNYVNPPLEGVMGPPKLANSFRALQDVRQREWETTRASFEEEIRPLVDIIQESLGQELGVSYRQARWVLLHDCVGLTPHFFAVRFKEPSQTRNRLGVFRRPIRTVVLFGDFSSEYRNREKAPLFIYVNSAIKPQGKPQEILDMTLHHMEPAHQIETAKVGLANPVDTYFDTLGILGPREFLN